MISKRIFLVLFLLSVLSGAFVSCKKDNTTAASTTSYDNRLGFFMADNFDLTLFNVGLTYTHYTDTLLQPGPYTVLAPSDEAFEAAGYGTAVDVQAAGGLMTQIIGYHILKGVYQLDLLPYEFNQEIHSLNGSPMYVTHWIKDGDTVITVNGATVTSSLSASNGLVQTLDQVLNPPIYGTIQQAITNDPDLTFFNAALLRTGYADTLRGVGPYTVFAPINEAFQLAGFPSTDSINKTDPAVLGALLSYHILSNRRFINDFILTTGATGISQQAMLDGNNVTISLVQGNTPGTYSGITLQGSGNANAASLVRQNVLAGNGVLHTIGEVLETNF